MDLINLGSKTARNGFQNEQDVVDIFNSWQTSPLAQEWLKKMNYKISEIENVKAVLLNKIIPKPKSDVNLQVKISWKNGEIDIQNLSVKLVSNKNGFNQIDKRRTEKYTEMWNIPDEITQILKHFSGEIPPKIKNPKDPRRMFANEFTSNEQKTLLNFLQQNRILIVSDILRGRGDFSADWMLVVVKKSKEIENWALEEIGLVMNFFGSGDIEITKRGSIKIGRITFQRKGGDGGRDTANMLQFKIDPSKLCDLRKSKNLDNIFTNNLRNPSPHKHQMI